MRLEGLTSNHLWLEGQVYVMDCLILCGLECQVTGVSNPK